MALDKSNPKIPPTRLINQKFLEAVDIIIDKAMADNIGEICQSIGFRRAGISQMKNNAASITLDALYNAINLYGLNPGFFFSDEPDLFNKSSVAYKNKVYELLAENILLSAPEELHDSIKVLLEENRRANKVAKDYEKEAKAKEKENKKLRDNQLDFADILAVNNKELKKLREIMAQAKEEEEGASDS